MSAIAASTTPDMLAIGTDPAEWWDPVRAVVARLTGTHTDERAWSKGARGERWAARWLARLLAGWHVLDDVPVGSVASSLGDGRAKPIDPDLSGP